MNRTWMLSIATLALLAGSLAALPVEIHHLELAPGADAYRLAAESGLKVFYAQKNQLLAAGGQQLAGDPRIISRQMIYRGDSQNLKWAYLKKGFTAAAPAHRVIFSQDGTFLLEAPGIKGAMAAGQEAFRVRDFSGEPIVLNPGRTKLFGSLKSDPSIAALVSQIDTAGVRADIEALQAFNTRSTAAPNHPQVAEWIRDEFLGYGIADVVIDSYVDPGFTAYSQYYFANSDTYKVRNVVATIPGTLDTQSVYIVGGHYDTSVWPYNPWAPGADDNGSGTAAVLQAARVLAANPPRATVKLIALDCEEWGLYGSEHAAALALSSDMKLQCMMNYDMIGSIGNDSTFVSKLYPGSENYARLLGQMAEWYGRTADTNLVPVYNSVYLNGSDSWEFHIRGFPVTYGEEHAFSPVYHQTNDSTTYMNMRYCTSIIKAGMGLVGTLANYPQKVAGLAVSDLGNGSSLEVRWEPNRASNIVGYEIYYGYASGDYGHTVYTTSTCDTLTGLVPNVKCYIAVRAFDSEGNGSPMADEVVGIPVQLALDQGILVVDETQNWTSGSFPRDTTQDKYYRALLEGYKIAEHEFGSDGQKPALVDLAPYSTVFWHSDDYSSLLMKGCLSDLELYLSHGGKLVLAGWKPSADVTGSTIDTMHYYPGSFMYDYFKVSQMRRSLASDSLLGAVGKLGYPDVAVDPGKVPVASWGGTMRYVEHLTPVPPAEGIYDIDMKNDGSVFEGLNCGVRYLGGDFKTVLLGFPLYFMEQGQAKTVVQKIMDDLGEVNGVGGEPNVQLPVLDFRLWQNAPNPFGRNTVISYQLPRAGDVSLKVYNIAGQMVKTLVDQKQGPGIHSVSWDRRDNQGRPVSAGVYIYHLNIGDQAQSRKMIVLK
jgi:hypothetical protein